MLLTANSGQKGLKYKSTNMLHNVLTGTPTVKKCIKLVKDALTLRSNTDYHA